MTSIQKGAACLLNNVGMAFGVKLIAQYEGTGKHCILPNQESGLQPSICTRKSCCYLHGFDIFDK